jgi:hypothetical protein
MLCFSYRNPNLELRHFSSSIRNASSLCLKDNKKLQGIFFPKGELRRFVPAHTRAMCSCTCACRIYSEKCMQCAWVRLVFGHAMYDHIFAHHKAVSSTLWRTFCRLPCSLVRKSVFEEFLMGIASISLKSDFSSKISSLHRGEEYGKRIWIYL